MKSSEKFQGVNQLKWLMDLNSAKGQIVSPKTYGMQ